MYRLIIQGALLSGIILSFASHSPINVHPTDNKSINRLMSQNKYKSIIYSVEIELDKSPEDVFSHLVKLDKWWPEHFDGEPIQLNSEFVFTTGDNHYSKNKVIEFVPNKKLAWITLESIRKSDSYDWSGTKFIFDITSSGNKSKLKFTYDGLVLEAETEKLKEICDVTAKQMFYLFIVNGKQKTN